MTLKNNSVIETTHEKDFHKIKTIKKLDSTKLTNFTNTY
jgi:hypothetical protein